MRRWRLAWIAVFSAAVLGVTSAFAMPTIRRGDDGPLVEQLQDWLRHQGYRIDDNGVFGRATDLAVRAVQRSSSLRPDGIVSIETWLALARKLLRATEATSAEITDDRTVPRILPPVFAEEASPADTGSAMLDIALASLQTKEPTVLPAVAAIEAALTEDARQSMVLSQDRGPASLAPEPVAAPSSSPNVFTSDEKPEPLSPGPTPLSLLASHEDPVPATDPLQPDLFIEVPPGFDTDPVILQLTSPRMTGKSVMVVQALLGQVGYKLDVDGNFGTSTVAAVRDFQRRSGQKVDGRVGRLTRKALIQAQPGQSLALIAPALAASGPEASSAPPGSAIVSSSPRNRSTRASTANIPWIDRDARVSDTP